MAQKQYAPEELQKLYEKLPEELREAVFSQETADHIFNICDRNGVEDVSKIAYYAGLVLMGILLPADFQKTLQKEIGLEEPTAKSIATEINRFVFYPVKPALEQLHRMEIEVAAKATTPEPSPAPEETPRPRQEKPEERKGPDDYREPLE
ncbi:MAG: hypothetical protein HYS52_00935 [Candidatus Wildermuthbacteria bacterium]|nr:hypothetical protein [Candidatus Wildermuthbacteria bacterium]